MALDVDPVRVEGVWYRHLRETAWAEWYRQIDELALRPVDELPRNLWRLQVRVGAIADLPSNAQLARVGLALPLPIWSKRACSAAPPRSYRQRVSSHPGRDRRAA